MNLPSRKTRRHSRPDRRPGAFGRFRAAKLLSGILAVCWLLLRSSTKPTRLGYPCQQAAVATAAAAFGLPIVAAILWLRRAAAASMATRSRWGGAVVIAFVAFSSASFFLLQSTTARITLAPVDPPPGYQATVYVIDDAAGPAGQNFGGLDDLVLWMGLNGLKLYQSNTHSDFESGPAGIIAAQDVVVIKINYQWSQRGGSNVDVLRGLVRRLVDHPDGFTGEIVVCENAQFLPVNNFDRGANNAEDTALSPHDVVLEFQAAGYNVSQRDWTALRTTIVSEYASGDLADGYVFEPYDAALQGRISYPKFQTSQGAYVSLRYGLWDPQATDYDRTRLKFINLPVLKSHHAAYGVTACVKDYMGVVSSAYDTNSHYAVQYGLLGGLLSEIRLADLNILDCIWINADPYTGPSTTYEGATFANKLVAGVDPVAIDVWAAKNVLLPAFVANGFSPPWPAPSADPDDPSSAFRTYLDNSMNRLLASGISVTNDLAHISAQRWNGDSGIPGDVNGDAAVDGRDMQPFVEALVAENTEALQTLRADLDKDKDVDESDLAALIDLLLGV